MKTFQRAIQEQESVKFYGKINKQFIGILILVFIFLPQGMGDLFLFNSLSKKLEKFQPKDPNDIKVYICGPTVIMQEYFKYDITLVMNITNIDDKIINRSNESNIPWKQLADRFEHEFLMEMENLNVLRPNFITRVNEYVPEIIQFIEKLESKGFAYEFNGSVYFDLEVYKKSHRYNLLRPETTKAAAETNPIPSVMEGEVLNSDIKKNQDDFVLWKASKDNEPSYSSKWGLGRPGWHIECSVMASEVFGNKLDIHAGGIDLCFPHHENEIAQCHAYFDGDNNEQVDGLERNTMGDDEKDPSISSDSWVNPMNYDPEQIKRAEATKKKLYNFISNVDAIIQDRINSMAGTIGTCKILDQMDSLKMNSDSKDSDKLSTVISERCLIRSSLNDLDKSLYNALKGCKTTVDESFCNNLNTSKALDAILNLITTTNINLRLLHSDILITINSFVKRILKIFGLLEHYGNHDSGSLATLDTMANILNDFRSNVRLAAKNKMDFKKYFELCDSVRNKIRDCGYQIDDEKEGSLIRKTFSSTVFIGRIVPCKESITFLYI
ncbi:unnamed protein product [Medioppia subpectinata]|uniref:Cysteine--tRNA ligase, cytoplasmic n=1 Tax=Medioppia subpectinata TaxID=1979941 RepID=A0A7R9KDK6_9ACAR|nr:unnamed protein product [Medioppia subpectinata]CAG2101146.1 unnamed protein product [Medioppia subpectinata]